MQIVKRRHYSKVGEFGGLFFDWKKKAFLIKVDKKKKCLNCWLLSSNAKKEKFASNWAVSIILSHLTTSFILIKDFRVIDKIFIIEDPIYRGYSLELNGGLVKINQAAVVDARLAYFDFIKKRGMAFAKNGKKLYLPLSKLASQQREILPGRQIKAVVSRESFPWAEIWEISKGGENGFSDLFR